MVKKKNVPDFHEMKKKGDKITFLTAYDFPTAKFAEDAGLDMLLVGDSRGMCVYGYKGTIPVVMGHIGLTPQSSGQLGGHKAQGRTAEAAKLVVEDALAVQAAGGRMILLEAIPPEIGKYITANLDT
jgi:ketopantoate hydroxymethyltransferase